MARSYTSPWTQINPLASNKSHHNWNLRGSNLSEVPRTGGRARGSPTRMNRGQLLIFVFFEIWLESERGTRVYFWIRRDLQGKGGINVPTENAQSCLQRHISQQCTYLNPFLKKDFFQNPRTLFKTSRVKKNPKPICGDSRYWIQELWPEKTSKQVFCTESGK